MTPTHPIERVLQVHTQYRFAGGEDRVVDAEKQLLEQAGIHVRQVVFDNDDIRDSHSLQADLGVAASAVWSRKARDRVQSAIRDQDPHVVHVHNTFAAASPSVYRAAMARNLPAVQTLHNYRFVCPSATTFRDGHPCTDCVGRTIPWPAILHACVRNSHSQSAVSAATLVVHRAAGTFAKGIDAYIALTDFQSRLMTQGGLPKQKITVIPNFLERDPGNGFGSRRGVLFVGRLSEEKGIATLVAAATKQRGTVRVAGQGPLREMVERAQAGGHIEYLGSIGRDAVFDELKQSVAVVLPSIWFEGFPMTVVEAYASGTPVIASRIGSLAELVSDRVTGLLFAPGDARQLATQMKWAVDHPTEMLQMGATARRVYEEKFTGPSHLASLMDMYERAVRRKGLAVRG